MLCFNKSQTEGGKWWPWSYVIEVQGNPVEAYDAVRKVFEEVSGVPFEGEYTDQAIQSHFEQSIRLAKIVVVFACVAVLISFLGLLAMSTYFIRQRAQEVAIRKVFGSESREILRRLIGTYAALDCDCGLSLPCRLVIISCRVGWQTMRIASPWVRSSSLPAGCSAC